MIKRIAFACLALTLLASCGYRGALYLPEEAPVTPPVEEESSPEKDTDEDK